MIDTGSETAVARLGVLGKLEALGHELFVDRSPVAFPAQHVATFVRYLPWVALVFIPVHLAAVSALAGVTAFVAHFGIRPGFGALDLFVRFGLEVAALPGLFRSTHGGWRLYTLGVVLGVVASVLTVDVIGIVFGVGCLWLMFQVRGGYAA